MAVHPNTPQEWMEALTPLTSPWFIKPFPQPPTNPPLNLAFTLALLTPRPDLSDDGRGDDVIELEVRMMMMMDDNW